MILLALLMLVNVLTLFHFSFSFKEFLGPSFNGDSVVSSNLTMPAPARWVVFNPEEPLTPNENNLCMRVDVLSCGKGKQL